MVENLFISLWVLRLHVVENEVYWFMGLLVQKKFNWLSLVYQFIGVKCYE